MASCSRCHGRCQVPDPNSFFGYSTCTHCSGTGQEPSGKPADWFFGDAPKGGSGKGGSGCFLIGMFMATILAIGIALGLWTL